jgi:flagellar basal body-associated protein FliL
MNLMKPSMLRRMVVGQLLTIVVFCAVTAINLLWQFKKNETGNELDKDTRIMAQSLANTLDPRTNTPAQMHQKIEAFYKLKILVTNLPYMSVPLRGMKFIVLWVSQGSN